MLSITKVNTVKASVTKTTTEVEPRNSDRVGQFTRVISNWTSLKKLAIFLNILFPFNLIQFHIPV